MAKGNQEYQNKQQDNIEVADQLPLLSYQPQEQKIIEMDLSVLEPDLSEYLADHPGVSIYGGIIATTMTLLTQVPKPMLNNCLFNPSYSWALSEQNAAVQLMGGKLEELLSSVSILPLDLD